MTDEERLEMKRQSDLNIDVYRNGKLIIRNRGKQPAKKKKKEK